MGELRFTKQFEIKLAGDDSGIFEGLASVYGNVDSYGDVVEPGAFSKTIAERGRSVPILWQHDQKQPIGTGEVYDAKTGLGIRGRILPSLNRGREALTLLKEGVIKGLSIGYSTVKDAWDPARKVRLLKELKLYEVSVVTFPANELASVEAVGGGSGGSKRDDGASVAAALRELRYEKELASALRQIRTAGRR